MKIISFNDYVSGTAGKFLVDLKTVPMYMRRDYVRRNSNVETGKSLCKRCDGTGNELFSMYGSCTACKGTGVKNER